MCKVVSFLATDVIFVISLWLHDNCDNYHLLQFFVNIESKTLYPLTSSTNLPVSFSSFSSTSVLIPTPTVTGGKWMIWIKISCPFYVNFRVMFGT